MSKMYVILVIILVKTIVSADDSSDETKYIDLLPEKEKEDFLERIARRIFDGVQSKDDRDAVSGEVSEAELDEQDKFVKDILKQESLNMRKRGDVNIDDKTTNDIDPNKKDEDNHVKDEALNKDIQDSVDDSSFVDLTLRDGKRNKRNSFRKTNADSKIIHVSVGNGEIDVPDEKNDLSNVPSTQDQDEFDVKDIQIKNLKQNLRERTNELEITTSSSWITQMVDFNEEPVNNDSEEPVKKDSNETGTVPGNIIGLSPKKIQSFENKVKKSNDNENIGEINNYSENVEYNRLGSTQKIFESLENEDNKNDSQNVVPKVSQSTATSEFTSPEIKAPVEITENLSNKNDTSEGHKNVSPNARVLRTHNMGVDSENNRELEFKDILNENPEDDAKEKEGTLVTGVTVHDLEIQTNLNIKTEAGNVLENVTSDVISTEKTTPLSATYKEETTENYDVGTTTLNTEVITEASMRTGEETTMVKESKEFKRGQIINLKQLKKMIDNTEKINSKELIGGELFKNMTKKDKEDKPQYEVNNKIYKVGNAQEKLDKNMSNLANDMIKVLRTEIRSAFNSNENSFNGLRDLYESTKSNEYRVYAAQSKQLFKQKDQQDTANKDNQYYVPVYNYSPENAYYDPRNRLGPNADDDDENVINVDVEGDRDNDLDANEKEDIDRDNASHRSRYSKNTAGSDELLRESYHKNRYSIEDLIRGLVNYKKTRKFRFGKTKNDHDKTKPYKVNLPVVVHYPKFTDLILNPKDYSDIDYHYGRTLQKPYKRNRCELNKDDDVFPDSTEQDYPYNNMKYENNLKDHMRSARMLLFRQKHFGYIPEASTESVELSKEVLRSKQTNSKDYKDSYDKNIAMDYFFGRTSDDVHTFCKKIDSKYPERNRYYHEHTNKNVLANNKYTDGLKNKNKKYPYKYDQTPYKNSLNYNINKYDPIKIPYKAQTYKNNYINPATPSYTDVPRYYYQKPLRAKDKKTKSDTTDYETIKKILSMTDANDLLQTLEKLRKLNLTTRMDDEINLEPYVEVLGDMVKNNAKALKQYNWLQTTVDIQAALAKLMDMTEELQNNVTMSQPDLQLLKYTIYLHKSARAVQVKDLRKQKLLLPRNRKKKKRIITESGLLNRQWLIRMLGTNHEKVITKQDLKEFNEFLNDLQYYLYDLHTAVQQIADITKFKRQKWFKNLKDLYLDTKVKRFLEVLLHITTTRLLDLVEESAKNGVEEDYLTFVMHNEIYVEKAKEVMGVMLRIIEELKFQ